MCNYVIQDLMETNNLAKILIVEHEPAQADELQRLLESAGYEVRVTHNGEEALVAMRLWQPTLVLSDILMPGMSGYDLCRTIKSDDALKHIPIVLATTLSDPWEIVEGLASGAKNFIVKPYEEKRLLSRISALLSTRKPDTSSDSKTGVDILKDRENSPLSLDVSHGVDLLVSDFERAVQKHAELSEAHDSYYALLKTNTAAVVVLDRSRQVKFANPAAEKMFERQLEEWEAQPFEYLLRSGEGNEVEVVRRDGAVVVAEMWVVETRWKGEAAYLVSLRDITQRKRAERAMRKRNRELSLLHRISRMFSSSLDLDTVIETALREIQRSLNAFSTSVWLIEKERNGVVCLHARGPGSVNVKNTRLALGQGLTGWAAEHNEVLIIADTWADERSHKKMSRRVKKTSRSMISVPLRSKGEVVGVLNLTAPEVNHFSQDDLQLLEPIASSMAVAIENARLYAAAQDEIAERKRMELALREAKEAADAANHAKSLFLANMSHELRTPLNAILGFSYLLRHHGTVDAIQQKRLDIINRSGEHLLTLINQVLDISKIEAGRMTLDEVPFELPALLEELIDLFRLRAEKKNLLLISECKPGLPHLVYGDEVKLRQVLINLLNNALKFTQKGSVQLSVCSQPIAKDLTQESADSELPSMEHSVQFAVKDTGVGMAAEELEQLFEAFVQTESGRIASEGTGLGLVISQNFVSLMGGEIHVESAPGKGATFSFTIPIKVFETALPLQDSSSLPVIGLEPGQPRFRILLVDKHEENRRLLQELLQPLEFELREALNGREALDVWAAWQPDLILIGLLLPVMNGYEVMERIRTLSAEAPGSASDMHHVPRISRPPIIIALTASAVEEERHEALSKGFDDFLRKPFKAQDFFELLKKHLGLKFIHGERASSSPVLDEPIQDDAMKKIPAELVRDLHHAAGTTDIMKLSTIIQTIREYDDNLAEQLETYVNNFDYDHILKLSSDAMMQG
ncbi:hypothetical protein CSB45_11895 [candidate division KSB3 bacterium]|uniref:histidine kinase n=1 Tax=candidate division KSB3 bacterium TaxID=2044937 RepID=A0A2G6E2Q4_9BACT|nr:MAG: hypothetical protein CSB45_11895 [candidate division KSB3 bacterium]